MSLLLEALKKAALEKQSRSEPSGRPAKDNTTVADDSLVDTLQQADDVEPIPENAAEETSTDQFTFEIDEHEIDAVLNAESDNDDDLEDELKFEPEFDEADASIEPEPVVTGGSEAVELADPSEQMTEEPAEQTELDANSEEEIIDLVDEAEIAAGLKQIEQEHLRAQQRIKDEERLEAERKRIALAAEEERTRNEEAEAKRAADIAAQERQRQAAQNKDALDQLITSGKQIRKKAQRRSAFLYILLVLTALGGLFAYYVFLIANTGKSELQTNPIVQPNPDIADVAQLIQSIPGEAAGKDTNPAATEPSTEPGDEADPQLRESAAKGTTSIDENTTALEGQVGSLNDNPQPVTEAAASKTSVNTNIARRLDPPPSATAYLQPLIRNASGTPQTENLAERVIIHHKAKPRPINDLVQQAYQALQANQVERADELYREVLRQEPDQRDALLGAAATATALGLYDQAIGHYQTRLQSAPSDTYARAGLLGLASSASSRDQVQQEVNTLLQANPESAQLHFIKGVGLASGRQWQAAQSAFYEAYSRDNTNPDYAFNLAVSLDHLGQLTLARVYYERAIELSSNRKIHFELAEAQRRISELKP